MAEHSLPRCRSHARSVAGPPPRTATLRDQKYNFSCFYSFPLQKQRFRRSTTSAVGRSRECRWRRPSGDRYRRVGRWRSFPSNRLALRGGNDFAFQRGNRDSCAGAFVHSRGRTALCAKHSRAGGSNRYWQREDRVCQVKQTARNRVGSGVCCKRDGLRAVHPAGSSWRSYGIPYSADISWVPSAETEISLLNNVVGWPFTIMSVVTTVMR
jgi:hypothetical protein